MWSWWSSILLEALGSIPAPHPLCEMVLIPALGWGRGSAVQGFKVILGYIVSSRGEGGKRESSNSDSLFSGWESCYLSAMSQKVLPSQSPQENPSTGSISHQNPSVNLSCFLFSQGQRTPSWGCLSNISSNLTVCLKPFLGASQVFLFLSSFCLCASLPVPVPGAGQDAWSKSTLSSRQF